jgi:hypothetical protein
MSAIQKLACSETPIREVRTRVSSLSRHGIRGLVRFGRVRAGERACLRVGQLEPLSAGDEPEHIDLVDAPHGPHDEELTIGARPPSELRLFIA